MGRQIHVDLERMIPAPPARVRAALADHRGRARFLPRLPGGGGRPGRRHDRVVPAAGGQAGASLPDGRRRAGPGVTLVERDRDSSLITTWILNPTASGTATDLKLSTVWEGGGGVGGFFGRTFAPRGLRRIHSELLDRVTREVGAEPTG